MDAVANGALGADHRPADCSAVRTHSRRQAAPGDGLPVLPGHYPAGRSVLTGSHGGSSGARTPYGSVPLPECQVDPEELARCPSAHSPVHDIAATSARQHPWRRVLRVRTRGDAETTDYRKTGGNASSRNGRGVEGPRARSVCPRAELPGAFWALGGSTVELAGEPGTRPTPEERQAAHAKRLR